MGPWLGFAAVATAVEAVAVAARVVEEVAEAIVETGALAAVMAALTAAVEPSIEAAKSVVEAANDAEIKVDNASCWKCSQYHMKISCEAAVACPALFGPGATAITVINRFAE